MLYGQQRKEMSALRLFDNCTNRSRIASIHLPKLRGQQRQEMNAPRFFDKSKKQQDSEVTVECLEKMDFRHYQKL